MCQIKFKNGKTLHGKYDYVKRLTWNTLMRSIMFKFKYHASSFTCVDTVMTNGITHF